MQRHMNYMVMGYESSLVAKEHDFQRELQITKKHMKKIKSLQS